jgi:hypothetical protein
MNPIRTFHIVRFGLALGLLSACGANPEDIKLTPFPKSHWGSWKATISTPTGDEEVDGTKLPSKAELADEKERNGETLFMNPVDVLGEETSKTVRWEIEGTHVVEITDCGDSAGTNSAEASSSADADFDYNEGPISALNWGEPTRVPKCKPLIVSFNDAERIELATDEKTLSVVLRSRKNGAKVIFHRE